MGKGCHTFLSVKLKYSHGIAPLTCGQKQPTDGRWLSNIVRSRRQGVLQGAVLGRNPVVAYQTERYILLLKVRILAVYPETRSKA